MRANPNARCLTPWLSWIIAASMLLVTPGADGRPTIRTSFFEEYPSAVGTPLDTLPSAAGHCGVCHLDFANGGGPKNPYGDTLAAIGGLNTKQGRRVAIQTAAGGDQDGDGFATVTELEKPPRVYTNTPTFPGWSAANYTTAQVTLSEIAPYLKPQLTIDTTRPQVTVSFPNGGEEVTANQPTTVEWTASDASGIAAIHIYESLDNGVTFKPVVLGLANTGTYSWVPANRPTTSARIRVVAVDGAVNTNDDMSNAAFKIVSPPGGKVPTTLRDFDMPGSQPFEGGPEAASPTDCAACHGNYNAAVEPYRNWEGSMMAQASRDPLIEANLVIANQDAPDSGDLCLRCHNSRGWLQGRSVPTSGARMVAADKIGVSCDHCHRMVDPVDELNVSPARDTEVLAALSFPGAQYGNGMFVVDPSGIQRGPFSDATAPHQFVASPFHRTSAFCGTCHDVSNPAFTKDGNGIYQLNELNTTFGDVSAHSAGPVERTYSEWVNSEYNSPTGVYQPEFAGNKPGGRVSTCQDCHMHDVSGVGCNVAGAPTRADLPLHDMTGGSTWVPTLIANQYPADVNAQAIQAGIGRARSMLQNAADLAVSVQSGKLAVRVTNQTGHKLPTGYPEGRRIWVNTKFFNAAGSLIGESGAYDPQTGVLTRDAQAKIYEVHPGIGDNISTAVGLPAQPSLHFVLNNKIYEDNRIPPRGFTNAAFAAFGGAPVGHTYADNQHWDETPYTIPAGAARAEVRLFYQSTSKEFVEFLRDENTTNTKGQEMYDLWNNNGKCPPELMAEAQWTAPQIEFAGVTGATPGIESATLSWAAASGGSPPLTYRIYQASTSGTQDFGAPVLSTNALTAAVGPLDPGSSAPLTYHFVVRASDSGGGSEANTVELAVQPLLDPAKDQDHDGMANGLEQLYGMDPFGSADAMDDSDADGLNNFAESALASDPTDAASANWPAAARVETAGLAYFALRYIRPKNSTTAEIVVEVSANLGIWNSGPDYTALHDVSDNPDGTATVIERMKAPITSASGGFMRLRIVPK